MSVARYWQRMVEASEKPLELPSVELASMLAKVSLSHLLLVALR